MLDTRTALLQALFSGESYGLELIQRVATLTHGRLILMQGRVYPLLREMEEQGLLRSFDGPAVQERGGRPRRYYQLTGLGRRSAIADAKAITGLLEASVV